MSKLAIIGAGNVAYHLAKAFQRAGHDIVQVYSRTQEKAEALSSFLKCSYTFDVSAITHEADVYLFCLSDSAITKVLSQGIWYNKLLLHTAGSVPISVFGGYSESYGVLYPFQTFTADFELNIREVPFFIEGNTFDTAERLKKLALQLSPHVEYADTEKRAQLHLAGVFVNNFTNHLIAISQQILINNNIDPVNAKPLLEETLRKAFEISPFKAQTGPAIRGNNEIMEKHLLLLKEHPEWQKIYTFVSESIQKKTIHG